MNFYDRIDFLEFFDTERIIDEEPGIIEYKIASSEGVTLKISMITCEGRVNFTLISKAGIELIAFGFDDIAYITCDKNKPGLIRFLFYREGKEEEPVVTVLVKPTISLSLNTE
jgi:hypothetical protein